MSTRPEDSTISPAITQEREIVKKSNLAFLAEIEQLRRRLARLDDGFSIAREDALSDGSRVCLERFRELSRTRFQPECRTVRTELDKIDSCLIPGEEWHEEARAAVRNLRKKLGESLARFIGTPNRLMRNAELISRIAPQRRDSAPHPGLRLPAVEPERTDPDLRETDPPIPCPVCGSTLMTDKEFTLLFCPSCGIGESLEPDLPENASGEDTGPEDR